MEVQIPDAGWLNGPTQLLLMEEFIKEHKRLTVKMFLEHLAEQAREAGERERELIGAGQYL